jgi:hypothetical protein
MKPEDIIFYESDIPLSPKTIPNFQFNTSYTTTSNLKQLLKDIPRVGVDNVKE